MADLTPEQQATLDSWSTIDCSSGEVYFPNPNDAHSFYQCVNGVPYLHQCPAGLVYNPTLKVCDWPENVSVDENPAPR